MNNSDRQSSEPDDQVEVTPAMERAGLEALWGFDLQEDNHQEIVREVYLAMNGARQRRSDTGIPVAGQ